MIFQSDLVIKAAIEMGLEDLRKNPWLIDDILDNAISNPYLKDKYGNKQISACKEWFANNQIDIYMVGRKDRDRLPCITITLGSSSEKEDRKTMADQSTETVKLLPQNINKPIPYVVKPFSYISYDPSTGLITVPTDIPGAESVVPGMILVNPQTGEGFVIEDTSPYGFVIGTNLAVPADKLGVVPQHQYYEARVEHSFFQETYSIGCHAHGDPQTLLWLHSLVLYSLLRYREGLFEANGFSESVLSSSDMVPSSGFSGPAGEEGFSRFITLTGMVENSWIKTPRRVIESVGLRERISNGYIGGIKILSNTDPDINDEENQLWYPIDEDA